MEKTNCALLYDQLHVWLSVLMTPLTVYTLQTPPAYAISTAKVVYQAWYMCISKTTILKK